jgi:hypothetical protein
VGSELVCVIAEETNENFLNLVRPTFCSNFFKILLFTRNITNMNSPCRQLNVSQIVSTTAVVEFFLKSKNVDTTSNKNETPMMRKSFSNSPNLKHQWMSETRDEATDSPVPKLVEFLSPFPLQRVSIVHFADLSLHLQAVNCSSDK